MSLDNRFTPEGLPIISKERKETFSRDFARYNNLVEITQKWMERLKDDNEEVYNFICDHVKKCPPEQRPRIYRHLIGLYELLRTQARAYQMEDEEFQTDK